MNKEIYFDFPSELFSFNKYFFSGRKLEFDKWLSQLKVASENQMTLILRKKEFKNVNIAKPGSHKIGLYVVVLNTPTGAPRALILVYQVQIIKNIQYYTSLFHNSLFPLGCE